MTKRTGSTFTDRPFRHGSRLQGTFISWIGLLLYLAVAFPSCTGSIPPAGEPIDLEALREFKPFQLQDLAGENRRLSDFLDKVTLVSFFFPT